MKNFFARPKSTAQPAEGQQYPDKWSPKVLDGGLGFGIVWIAKKLGYREWEIANTNSMLPVLDYGHILITKPVENSSDLREGDICVYKFGDSFIVHRFIRFSGNNLIFKGDNNFFSDIPVQFSQMVGRVVNISYER